MAFAFDAAPTQSIEVHNSIKAGDVVKYGNLLAVAETDALEGDDTKFYATVRFGGHAYIELGGAPAVGEWVGVEATVANGKVTPAVGAAGKTILTLGFVINPNKSAAGTYEIALQPGKVAL